MLEINNILEFRLSEYAYVGRAEKEFHDFYKDKDYKSPLIIDLSQVLYIQITTLVYLAQIVYKRELDSLKTFLGLPVSDEVRIFMFTWRFFEIIEELTGKNIFNYIVGNQKKFPPAKFNIEGTTFYLNINKDYFDKHYNEEQLKNLVKKGFFSLICEPFKEENQKYLALKKQKRTWSTEKLITDILQKNLLEDVAIGSLLANTIIVECLTNAANHPDSDHLVIGSFYDFTNKEKVLTGNKSKKNFFTIVIWDDGDSIINTLLDPINLNSSIRATDSFEVAKKSGYKPWFRIVRNNYTSNSNNESLFYDFLPTKESGNDEILLSSFLPGISRKPINKKEGTEESYISSSGTGLGLTQLLKAVIKDLNGSIHVRTSDYLLEIIRARAGGGIAYNDMLFYKNLSLNEKKEVDFYCKSELTLYNTKDISFKGNMITIKIPLNSAL